MMPPHPPPPELVPVDDVESLVRRLRRDRGPFEMAGQDPGVGDIGDRVVLLGRPREHERPAGLPADGGVDGQRHAHVHGIPDRPTDDRVRPMDRPGEPDVAGELPEDVFLVVVEVLVGETFLILPEGRVRLHERVGLERAQVVLEPGGEGDVLQARGVGNRGEEVAEHASVYLDVLGLGGLAGPGREEDVGRVDSGECLLDRRGIGQVGRDRGDPWLVGGRPPGDADHLPPQILEVASPAPHPGSR